MLLKLKGRNQPIAAFAYAQKKYLPDQAMT
jgi:hypothetical protein